MHVIHASPQVLQIDIYNQILERFTSERREIHPEVPLEAANIPRLKLSEWNWNLINPRYKNLMVFAMTITSLSLGASLMPWKLPRVWGITVLSTVGYGIINDLFACRVCPEYFTVGHHYDGQRTRYRLVETLDPNVNAIAWGMFATVNLAALGGTILSLGATLNDVDEKVVVISMIGYMALTLVVADVISRVEKANFERNAKRIYSFVPDQFQSRWHANNVRNSIGYASLITGAIVLSVLMSAKILYK